MNLFRNEPARVIAFVIAVIGVASAFGLGITDGQSAAIVAVVGAALALFGGEVVRSQVSPVNPTQPTGPQDPDAGEVTMSGVVLGLIALVFVLVILRLFGLI